jgi:hypothetical protein
MPLLVAENKNSGQGMTPESTVAGSFWSLREILRTAPKWVKKCSKTAADVCQNRPSFLPLPGTFAIPRASLAHKKRR